MLVEETLVIYPLAPWRYPDAVILVDETVVSDEDPTVRTPVEVANLNSALDVAPPPSWPKRICVSTHAVELGNA